MSANNSAIDAPEATLNLAEAIKSVQEMAENLGPELLVVNRLPRVDVTDAGWRRRHTIQLHRREEGIYTEP